MKGLVSPYRSGEIAGDQFCFANSCALWLTSPWNIGSASPAFEDCR